MVEVDAAVLQAERDELHQEIVIVQRMGTVTVQDSTVEVAMRKVESRGTLVVEPAVLVKIYA